MRALVIDDSRAMRSIIRKALTELGHSVTEAADGGAGLEALRSAGAGGGFDIALVDWNMPVLSGYEFVRQVRADHVYDGLRIMMVTTEVETDQVAKALQAGANEYLMKPFTPDMLREKLDLLAA